MLMIVVSFTAAFGCGYLEFKQWETVVEVDDETKVAVGFSRKSFL